MRTRQQLLALEERVTPVGLRLFVVLAVSGLASWGLPGYSVAEQLLQLIHAAAGVAFAGYALRYSALHVQRTIGVRRLGVAISGFAALALLLALVASGVLAIAFGSAGGFAWLPGFHRSVALATALLLGAHLALHQGTPRAAAAPSDADARAFPSLPARAGKSALVTAAALVAGTGAATLLYLGLDSVTGLGKVDASQSVVGECRRCHPEVVTEWEASAHRFADANPVYDAVVAHSVSAHGEASANTCRECHAPFANEGHARAESAEGVGCFACHGVAEVERADGAFEVLRDPQHRYLFAGVDLPVLNQLRRQLIRTNPEPHRADMGRAALRAPELCGSCHQQAAYAAESGFWLQNDYTAWEQSPHAKPADGDPPAARTECRECHMPRVAAAFEGAPAHASHRFPGANTALPFLRNDIAQFEATRAFLRSNKIQLAIEEPRRPDAAQTLETLKEELRTKTQTPYYLYLNEAATIRVIVTNSAVGHDFPGGTKDVNEAWLSVVVHDAAGEIVFENGTLDPNSRVDASAYFFGAQRRRSDGQIDWRHDQLAQASETRDTSIAPGRSRVLQYEFRVPPWAKGPLVLSAALKYRKLNAQLAEWALGERGLELPVVDVARASLAIPVRIRRELE